MLFSRFSDSLSFVLQFVNGISDDHSDVCKSLSAVISSTSDIHYPGQALHAQAISHWSSVNTQTSACVVEPGTADDIASILKVLGSTRTPFAVKGGGHSPNPGFSSTPGVHISMSRFSEVVYDESSQTATIGAGMVWDDVYAALEPFGVNVAGGRLSGVGVAGFMLGGGYSWKTNQYGLAIDTVQAYELVLPTGNVTTVTKDTNPDLFFALRGGGNNFGIVTKFTLPTYEQGLVWGGQILYDESQAESIRAATAAFVANVVDTKSCILPAYFSAGGVFASGIFFFYDAPNVPDGVFDDFLAIPHIHADIKTRSFTDLIASFGNSPIKRGHLNTVAVREWSPTFIAALIEETKYWSQNLTHVDPTIAVTYGIEPFLHTFLSHSNSSAFPPDWARDPSVATDPLNMFFTWSSESADEAVYAAMQASANRLKAVVVSEFGPQFQSTPLYPNYAIYGTPVEALYGENLPRLKSIARTYDPEGVMKLAGGFKFEKKGLDLALAWRLLRKFFISKIY